MNASQAQSDLQKTQSQRNIIIQESADLMRFGVSRIAADYNSSAKKHLSKTSLAKSSVHMICW